MRKPRKTQRITFRLTQDEKKRVMRLASRTGKDTAEFIRDVVLESLRINEERPAA